MNVLLLNPEFPDTYWSFRHALPFEGKRSAFPPLGLMTVSALLPKSWEKRLVDLNVRSLKSSDIEWADIVFATAMLVQKESLHDVVRRCKAKGKRVVLGGPYVTTTIEDLPEADHIFLGEAETTLPQFVADLERGEAQQRLAAVGLDLQQIKAGKQKPTQDQLEQLFEEDVQRALTDAKDLPSGEKTMRLIPSAMLGGVAGSGSGSDWHL